MSQLAYRIEGSDLQYVEIILPPGRAVIGEQGAMMYMQDEIGVNAVLGDGTASKYGAIGRFYKAVKRMFTGEALFSSRYANESSQEQKIAFATPSISKILAIDLDEIGGELICQKGAYLAGEEGIEIGIALQKRLRVGFFGGEGFVMQRISGTGYTFIGANGALTEILLAPGESLKVDSGCLVALMSTVAYEIKYAGKIKTAFFGGEGLFYASVTGPGKVWLQSLPERRLSAQLLRSVRMPGSGGISAKIYLGMVIIFVLISLFGGVKV